jgi:hypothetical protein
MGGPPLKGSSLDFIEQAAYVCELKLQFRQLLAARAPKTAHD